MTDRHRSKEKSRDSDRLLGAEDGAPTYGGRAGGRLAPRDISTKDEQKRAFERSVGATRVEKSDEKKGDDNA